MNYLVSYEFLAATVLTELVGKNYTVHLIFRLFNVSMFTFQIKNE